MLRRSPRLAQVAEVATFLASNPAAAITGSFVNLTSGTSPAGRSIAFKTWSPLLPSLTRTGLGYR
jgi:enoyl-[acyl-carrier-protein] reductase (NADH)